MITREEIRAGFAALETNEEKAEFCRQHMEQERELPELYENLVTKDGEKLFKMACMAAKIVDKVQLTASVNLDFIRHDTTRL